VWIRKITTWDVLFSKWQFPANLWDKDTNFSTPSIHLCRAYFFLAQRPRKELSSLFFYGKKQLTFIVNSLTLCTCLTPEVCMRWITIVTIPKASLPRKLRIGLAKMNFWDFIIGLAKMNRGSISVKKNLK
jgi:hypothetical protein